MRYVVSIFALFCLLSPAYIICSDLEKGNTGPNYGACKDQIAVAYPNPTSTHGQPFSEQPNESDFCAEVWSDACSPSFAAGGCCGFSMVMGGLLYLIYTH